MSRQLTRDRRSASPSQPHSAKFAAEFLFGKSVTIKDPLTGNPFPNNIIPKGQLSPNGLGILNVYPFPNQAVPLNGNQNWYLALNHPQHQRKDTLAVDANLTEKQRLAFRGQNYAYFEYQPLDGGSDRTPKFFDRPNQTNSLSHVWTISPTKVNEFLVTASDDVVRIPVDTAVHANGSLSVEPPDRLKDRHS